MLLRELPRMTPEQCRRIIAVIEGHPAGLALSGLGRTAAAMIVAILLTGVVYTLYYDLEVWFALAGVAFAGEIAHLVYQTRDAE